MASSLIWIPFWKFRILDLLMFIELFIGKYRRERLLVFLCSLTLLLFSVKGKTMLRCQTKYLQKPIISIYRFYNLKQRNSFCCWRNFESLIHLTIYMYI